MTDDIKTRIIADMSDMAQLTELYSNATSDILNTDIDETLEGIIANRAGIIEAIGKVRRDIDEACLHCTEQESDLIRRMIRGANVPLGMSAELREIHKAAVRLHSVYINVADKEKAAAARVDARVKELRAELQSLNSDRRKTSGYSAAGSGLGGSGGAFDGRL